MKYKHEVKGLMIGEIVHDLEDGFVEFEFTEDQTLYHSGGSEDFFKGDIVLVQRDLLKEIRLEEEEKVTFPEPPEPDPEPEPEPVTPPTLTKAQKAIKELEAGLNEYARQTENMDIEKAQHPVQWFARMSYYQAEAFKKVFERLDEIEELITKTV